ncbi:MAG: amylo-alpha-1,6-glucosidase [Prevotella sp.]|nr:amylo-alpha-1,6-glucosidase [Prevotella sp.]
MDELDIKVRKTENREYSFTDKKSGFWYGRTHQDKPVDWYAGWNVAKKRVLSDYTLFVDGKQMRRTDAIDVTVNPLGIRRQWQYVDEELRLLDNNLMLVIEVKAPKAKSISLSLIFPDDADKGMVGVYALDGSVCKKRGDKFTVAASKGGFLLVYGTAEEKGKLVASFRTDGEKLLDERRRRMEDIIGRTNPVKSNLPELDKALQWLTLTMDELITEQQGKGIYAGLPWFNEYWGRDMFIAMPGATLITGQFDYTKEILKDFSKFQDRNPNSPTCGRIPNRANLEGIIYNTADGTPRYVIETEELLNYCGDTSFLKDIYPSIVLSTDQSLSRQTDSNGYLMHEDADTWMDVKRNGIPGSPRGNRANDIQYLWYKQLMAASRLAKLMNDDGHAETWAKAAERVARNFERDYCNKSDIIIYDHLNADGTPDKQFRPNQLFCFDLVGDDTFKQKVTRRCWEELVYPWGVASLSQKDPQFHPQHENWHYYHKDDAYHNGTVWLWNNGIAMQRMIEYGQKEMAWQLFRNMNRQALVEGAVGSLSENADAHPRDGKSWAGLSGTFLQAWSNSEQLRVWYQHFLGIRPDMMNNTIYVEPRLPEEITDLETSMMVGNGKVCISYHDGEFACRLDNLPGVRLVVKMESSSRIESDKSNPIFRDLDFCRPRPLDHYPCFDVRHDPPLTY